MEKKIVENIEAASLEMIWQCIICTSHDWKATLFSDFNTVYFWRAPNTCQRQLPCCSSQWTVSLHPLGHAFTIWAWKLNENLTDLCLSQIFIQEISPHTLQILRLKIPISRVNYWPFLLTTFWKHSYGIIQTTLKQQVLWKRLASVTLMQNMNSVYYEIVLFVSYFHCLAVPVPG